MCYLIFNNCCKSSSMTVSLRTNQICSFFKCLIFDECFVRYKWEASAASLSLVSSSANVTSQIYCFNIFVYFSIFQYILGLVQPFPSSNDVNQFNLFHYLTFQCYFGGKVFVCNVKCKMARHMDTLLQVPHSSEIDFITASDLLTFPYRHPVNPTCPYQ